MPEIAPNLGLSFDRGIDRITYARHDSSNTLPERSESAPADIGARPQLETLLAMPSLDDALDSAIRPQLQNTDLLMPGRFRGALDTALTNLRSAAEQMQGQGASGAADPASADTVRVLNRGARVLSEESNLRDLVQMYRSALYQG